MSDLPAPPQRSLSPWQRLYETLHRVRWRWFSRRSKRLERTVISIGNLLWGGAGKTPVVAAVARHLRDRGLETVILSRGYGRKDKGTRVVSTGDGPLLGPKVAGDEPVLLAGELPGVAVVVGSDRYRAGRHALERLQPTPEIFLLDDGFSHLGLFRDIDLVVFPIDDPFGGGRLPPSGRLREPLSSMRRADAALLIGGSSEAAGQLAAVLRPYGFTGPGFSGNVELDSARLADGSPLATGSRVLALAAIARPDRFRRSALAAGFEIVDELFLADHHVYSERTLDRIEKAWHRSGAAAVLTTSKDRVKLLGRLHVPLAELPMRTVFENDFWTWLDRRLELQWKERAG